MNLVMGKYNSKKVNNKVLREALTGFSEVMKVDTDLENIEKVEINNLSNVFIEMKIDAQVFRTLLLVLNNTLKEPDNLFDCARPALRGIQLLTQNKGVAEQVWQSDAVYKV
jgi:hypothetical protein